MREEAFGPVVVVQSGRRRRCRARARQLLRVRPAGRLLHRRRSKPRSRSRASCASARSGSTTRAASGSTAIPSAASARAASAAKACATPWRSCRSGSSPACGSIRNDDAVGLIGCGGSRRTWWQLRGGRPRRRAHRRRARPRGRSGEARARSPESRSWKRSTISSRSARRWSPRWPASGRGRARRGRAARRDRLPGDLGRRPCRSALLARLKAAAQSGTAAFCCPPAPSAASTPSPPCASPA